MELNKKSGYFQMSLLFLFQILIGVLIVYSLTRLNKTEKSLIQYLDNQDEWLNIDDTNMVNLLDYNGGKIFEKWLINNVLDNSIVESYLLEHNLDNIPKFKEIENDFGYWKVFGVFKYSNLNKDKNNFLDQLNWENFEKDSYYMQGLFLDNIKLDYNINNNVYYKGLVLTKKDNNEYNLFIDEELLLSFEYKNNKINLKSFNETIMKNKDIKIII